jgi:hypothetical protein
MAPTASAFVASVQQQLGKPYVYGATGPGSFDCSGLVMYCLAQVGVTAPRTSEQQWAWVAQIPQSQLTAGALVFSQYPGDNASPGHVQIYIGGGQVIGADNSSVPVEVDQLSAILPNLVGYGLCPGLSYNGTVDGGSATAASLLSTTANSVGGALGAGVYGDVIGLGFMLLAGAAAVSMLAVLAVAMWPLINGD